MKMSEALEIVYDLAYQNALTIEKGDPDGLRKESRRQHDALAMVHDLIVNEYGED